MRALVLGPAVEASLSNDETHVYGLNLSGGQFVRFTVRAEDPASNIHVSIFGPDGGEIENLSARLCWCSLYYLPSVSGLYQVRLRLQRSDPSPSDKPIPAEVYSIQLYELREANDQDQMRVAANQRLTQACRQSWSLAANTSAEIYQEAISLFRATNDRYGEAEALQALSRRYFGTDYQAVINYLDQARALWQGLGERALEASTLEAMVNCLGRLGRLEEALTYSDDALRLRQILADRSGEARVLENRGDIYEARGELQQSLNDKEQALAIVRQTKKRIEEEYSVLYDLGHIYDQLGESQTALDYYRTALRLARFHRKHDLEFPMLSVIADAYAHAGEKQKALAYQKQSLAMARGDRGDEMWALRRLGEFYIDQGEYANALQCFRQVLPYFRAQHQPVMEALSLYRSGIAYHHLGNWQQALDALNQSLSIWPFKDRTRRNILQEIGSVYEDGGDGAKALDYYQKSLAEARREQELQGQAFALGGMARVESSMGQLSSAQRDIQAALEILESVRVGIASAESRSEYFATVHKYYEFYVDLLIRMHLDHAALEAGERARARSLIDMLTEAHVDVAHGVDPKLLDRERRLRQRLRASSEYQVALLTQEHTPEQADAIAGQLEALAAEYEQTAAQLRQSSPQYASLTHPSPLSVSQIQSSVLDSDTLLLEYALGKDRSYLWVLSKSSLETFALPRRTVIEQAARRFYRLLTARNSGQRPAWVQTGYPAAAERLSKMVLGPAASLIGKKRLVIVGDGALVYVPFAALP
ncbi:MAG: tetratricopeptide repeat protein, partial [Acidobacteria bacterium]|nr:tetratricopeptide repeat protein [Acidobacteriota bacterium]